MGKNLVHVLAAIAYSMATFSIVAFTVLAMLAGVASAQPPKESLEPPGPFPPARIVDSKIEVPRDLSAYWVDEETVIFNGLTSETWEHWTPLRQVPVHRVTTWNLRTGEIKRYDEVTSSSSRVLCFFQGRVLIRTYRKAGDGERLRKDGRYVEEWQGGSLGNITTFGPKEAESFGREALEQITCQPPSALPPVPAWILDSKWWYHKLPAEYGIKIDQPGTAPGDRTSPPLVCSYTSTSQSDCRPLPLPGGISYGWSYVRHLNALALQGHGYPDAGMWVGILRAYGFISAFTVERDLRRDVPIESAITKVGLVRVLTNSGDPSRVGDGGLWVWNRGNPKRLAATAANLAISGQGAVSPNGCAIAFGGNDRPASRRLTLRVAELCRE